MVRAFIMVKADAGDAEPLADAVADLQYVTEAHVVAGEFDVIAEAEAPEVRDVMHTAATEIRELSGVADTKTYVCLE
ncbi:Lrp/AsnC family transcriptional regulator [Halorarius halobius]|uniref:Lrp/AsnC family transcriptional regulator n=1 Tax=Halorarius halobius TaxID=2962671 RepID=UPI0020CE4395|nr:Lrp/AsnC ligand binding domain-containing protein [Halorarius halobius]